MNNTVQPHQFLKNSKVKFGESTESILVQSQHFPYLESLTNLEDW
jgi:hypothetical protein